MHARAANQLLSSHRFIMLVNKFAILEGFQFYEVSFLNLIVEITQIQEKFKLIFSNI